MIKKLEKGAYLTTIKGVEYLLRLKSESVYSNGHSEWGGRKTIKYWNAYNYETKKLIIELAKTRKELIQELIR